MTLSQFVLFAAYSLGLWWLIWQYKKFEFFRAWVRSLNSALLNELASCVYCQAVQASAVLYGLCLLSGEFAWHPVDAIAPLAVGLVAIASAHWIDVSIQKLEDSLEFSLRVEDNDSN